MRLLTAPLERRNNWCLSQGWEGKLQHIFHPVCLRLQTLETQALWLKIPMLVDKLSLMISILAACILGMLNDVNDYATMVWAPATWDITPIPALATMWNGWRNMRIWPFTYLLILIMYILLHLELQPPSPSKHTSWPTPLRSQAKHGRDHFSQQQWSSLGAGRGFAALSKS